VAIRYVALYLFTVNDCLVTCAKQIIMIAYQRASLLKFSFAVVLKILLGILCYSFKSTSFANLILMSFEMDNLLNNRFHMIILS
jgi:hypothetical protein